MKTYTSIPTSELKPGMKIHMNGHQFSITSKPTPSNNPFLEGTFIVGCEIVTKLPKDDYMVLLNDYKTIQANDKSTFAVIRN